MDHSNLYDFQKIVYERFKEEKSAALFLDLGTGKTPLTISLIRYKWGQVGGIVPTVVFVPLIILDNWRNELLKWTRLDASSIGVIKGTAKKRLDLISNEKHKIIIINYEALRSDAVVEALKKKNFRIAICDESQRIKSFSAQVTRKVIKLSKTADIFKAVLTGTPISNTIVDIWSQFLFLDGGKTFGNRMTAFKGRYMVNTNAEWCASGASQAFANWEVKKSMLPEFTRLIKENAARITTEEAVDLPEMVINRLDIELTPEQKKHYVELAKQFITWLEDQDDNPLVVKNALTKILRLNEISSGYMRLHDGTIHKFKKNPRLDACMELVEQSAPHKIIIFCIYSENYRDIRAGLEKRGISYVEITGEVSTDDKLEAARLFGTTDEGPRVCIANTRAAGLGVNLVGARYKIYYTRSYSLDDYLQSQKRNNRAGAVKFHSTLYDYHLVAPNTIDEVIYDRVIDKKEFADSILDIKKIIK